MKSNFMTIILLLILIILITGIVIFGKYIYMDLLQDTTSEQVFKVDNIITEEPSKDKSTFLDKVYEDFESRFQSTLDNTTIDSNIIDEYLYNSDVIDNFFYNQLSNNEKIIYNALSKNKSNLKQGNYEIHFDNNFSDVLSKENGSEELGKNYQTAIEAFIHDNPDLFYIDVNKMILNITTTTKILKTTYNVYISPSEGGTYLSDDFLNTEEIEKAIQQVENAKYDILSKAKGSEYQKILYIHDYLIDNLQYDSTYEKKGTYGLYGALVTKTCVCEGYAKAFKYLANSLGIECEIMQGESINSNNQKEKHAWNCVKLNENWYEIDPTWDDPIVVSPDGRVINESPSNDVRYKYFLKGSNTFEKDHTIFYQFSNNGKKFSYPNISQNDY